MSPRRIGLSIIGVALLIPATYYAQSSDGKKLPKSDLPLCERLLVARRNYQKALEELRAFYLRTGDLERAKWAEEELVQYHRIPKQAFRLELDLPPPTLQGNTNVTQANRLYTVAMSYKDRGWGTQYVDNQRRAEILLQKILTQYPQSNKISDTAYQLGDIYASKAYRQFKRASSYFERCFQWNPATQFDARIRAARIYDTELNNRKRAIDLYREVITHETDAKQIQEAKTRISELSATR